MKIILTDKIQKLGEIGDVVEVSSGYARNFLIPKKKAMFASDENLKYVESKKSELAAASADEMANAQGRERDVDLDALLQPRPRRPRVPRLLRAREIDQVHLR